MLKRRPENGTSLFVVNRLLERSSFTELTIV